MTVTESTPDGRHVALKQPFASGVADTMFPHDGEGWWAASRSRLFHRGDGDLIYLLDPLDYDHISRIIRAAVGGVIIHCVDDSKQLSGSHTSVPLQMPATAPTVVFI